MARHNATKEAQRRAADKFNKEKTVQFNLRLNKNTDNDVIEILQSQDNKRKYLIDAIREKAQKE